MYTTRRNSDKNNEKIRPVCINLGLSSYTIPYDSLSERRRKVFQGRTIRSQTIIFYFICTRYARAHHFVSPSVSHQFEVSFPSARRLNSLLLLAFVRLPQPLRFFFLVSCKCNVKQTNAEQVLGSLLFFFLEGGGCVCDKRPYILPLFALPFNHYHIYYSNVVNAGMNYQNLVKLLHARSNKTLWLEAFRCNDNDDDDGRYTDHDTRSRAARKRMNIKKRPKSGFTCREDVRRSKRTKVK